MLTGRDRRRQRGDLVCREPSRSSGRLRWRHGQKCHLSLSVRRTEPHRLARSQTERSGRIPGPDRGHLDERGWNPTGTSLLETRPPGGQDDDHPVDDLDPGSPLSRLLSHAYGLHGPAVDQASVDRCLGAEAGSLPVGDIAPFLRGNQSEERTPRCRVLRAGLRALSHRRRRGRGLECDAAGAVE